MIHCIAAFTPPGADSPPYINASEQNDGSVRVIVRSPKAADGQSQAFIDMTMDEWVNFVRQANAFAATINRPAQADEHEPEVA
jgi:hypothetical protein